MKTLRFVCIVVILTTWISIDANARVIAGDLSRNTIAVYDFNSVRTGDVIVDKSFTGFTGALLNGAEIRRTSGRKSLSLRTEVTQFRAWDDNRFISVSRQFSIVAWVKIPRQENNFLISVTAYDGPIGDIWHFVEAGADGGVGLAIDADNTLRGDYVFDSHRAWVPVRKEGKNVNDNKWHHVGLVVSPLWLRLYLDGQRIASTNWRGNQTFSGSGTVIRIGDNAIGHVDDVGFFKNSFTDNQMRLIYTVGLQSIVNIAPVDPSSKIATTWGRLKQ